MANNINLTMQKGEAANIDNSALIQAIKDMRADFTPETQNKVIQLALRATFFVPAILDKKTELVEGKDKRVTFEDKPTARFLLISNPERGTFFPAYTDRELLKDFKTDQPYQGFAMRFADLASLTEQTPTVNGFLINPDSEKLPFTKEILANIKQTLKAARDRAEAKKAAEASEGPNITVSTNENPEE